MVRAREDGERSTAYKVVIMPKPKKAVPMIGIIQWILACADHPYQLQSGPAF